MQFVVNPNDLTSALAQNKTSPPGCFLKITANSSPRTFPPDRQQTTVLWARKGGRVWLHPRPEHKAEHCSTEQFVYWFFFSDKKAKQTKTVKNIFTKKEYLSDGLHIEMSLSGENRRRGWGDFIRPGGKLVLKTPSMNTENINFVSVTASDFCDCGIKRKWEVTSSSRESLIRPGELSGWRLCLGF